MKTLQTDRYQSPLGDLALVACGAPDGAKLCYLDFAENNERRQKLLSMRYRQFNLVANKLPALRARLDAYFAGDWDAFDGLELHTGGTEFQRKVWAALQKIPRGETRSYKELAAAIGNPAAVRAVGGANAKNPIAIVIPCHRVIDADGSLGGYAGGARRKAYLLRHEGVEI